jgi:signal transduction histidine kinase
MVRKQNQDMSDTDKEDLADELAQLERTTHQIVCLRNTSRLLSDTERPLSEVLDTLVHMLPEGWQVPNLAVMRVIIDDKESSTTGFMETDLCIRSDVMIRGTRRGIVQVCYASDESEIAPDSFLEGEVTLLDTIADEIAAFVDRKDMIRAKEQQHRELGIIASLLRHDVRNDLGVILSTLDLARMITEEEDRELQDIMDTIEATCERILSLVSTLGGSARVADMNVSTLLSTVSERAEEVNRNLSVCVKVAQSAQNVQIPDSRLLPAVFDNLLRNSAVYGGANPQVTIDASMKDGNLEVIVSDDGPGIADEVRDRLFERGATTSGSGLGLYLSRQIVQGVGGTIDLVDGSTASGATFCITLPIRR